MSDQAVRIGVILASTRQTRRGEGFARWALGLVKERPGVEVELVNLRDYVIGAYVHEHMPSKAEAAYADEITRRWSGKSASSTATSS